MSNRYNQYVPVDYVNMPLDAYQLGLAAKEGDNLNQLEHFKTGYDELGNVEAVYNPDTELKEDILSNIHNQVQGLSGKNLKGTDVMLQLNRIINNRGTIDKLASIANNTVAYKAALTANKKYQETYGNDINTSRFGDDVAAYNKLDKSGFKPGFMAEYAPDKFVDVVGDMQKVLEHAKANGWSQQGTNGKWINKTTHEELSLDKLLQQSGMLLNDPKYQQQLKHLAYYNLRKYGTDPAQALQTYNSAHAAYMDQQITDLTFKLSELKQISSKSSKPDKYAKQIEDGTTLLKKLAERRDVYKKDNTGAAFNEDLLHGLSGAASAPYYYSKTTNEMQADPYGLLNTRLAGELSNWAKKHAITRKEALEDRSHDELLNDVNPIVTTATLKDVNGVAQSLPVLNLNAQGGYKMENMAHTVAVALRTASNAIDKDGNSVNIKDYPIDKITAGIANGSIDVTYVPGTKEYMITGTILDDNKKPKSLNSVRVAADLGMQKAMDPLYQLSDTKPINGFQYTMVSTDGHTDPQPIIVTRGDDKITHLYQPKVVAELYKKGKQSGVGEIDLLNKDLTEDDLKKMTGLEIAKVAYIRGGYKGPLIATEGEYKEEKPDGSATFYTKANRVFTPEELIEARKKGYIEKSHVLFYSNDGKITPVDDISGEDGGLDIIKSHVQYHSQPGRELYLLRDRETMLRHKVKSVISTKESSSSSEEENDNE